MPKDDKLRVVIDTNLFISGIIVENSFPGQLLNAWRDGKYTLLVSYELVEEIQRVIDRNPIKVKYHLSSEKIDNLLTTLKSSAEMVDPFPEDTLPLHSRDLKDDMLLALALGGHADYLITGDKDLLMLKNNPALANVTISSVKDFLASL